LGLPWIIEPQGVTPNHRRENPQEGRSVAEARLNG
jgi:hypothetical protein